MELIKGPAVNSYFLSMSGQLSVGFHIGQKAFTFLSSLSSLNRDLNSILDPGQVPQIRGVTRSSLR